MAPTAREPSSWYQLADGEIIEQGDLLVDLAVLIPSTSLRSEPGAEEIEGTVKGFDVVILSQTCDLAQEKIDFVVACPCLSLGDFGRRDLEEIDKGRRPRYLTLARSVFTDVAMDAKVVDFGNVFSIPVHLVQQHVRHQGKRLRLVSPYREHLAQSFARFYMRVALPQRALAVEATVH